MPPARHLLTVWNPSYAHNAMEEHLAILLDWSARREQGRAGDDDVYVWWGKVRSPNRQAPQAHGGEIRAIGRALAAGGDDDTETHLYLTDYRSLYVGELIAVAEGALPGDEAAHVPSYYAKEGLGCDFWFGMADIRRLVHDDLPLVIEQLRALRNVHYNDRPVSLYGGMVDLPLVVTRPDGARFFDPDERDLVIEGKLWAEYDATAGSGTAAVERSLREDLMGDAAWAGLELAARTSVATAEKLYREHRGDPAFDFGTVIQSFSKALEIQCNAILRAAMPLVPPAARRANLDGRTVDLGEHRSLMLKDLVYAIGRERELNQALCGALEHGGWFTSQLPAILDGLREVRNPGVHEARVDRQTATYWRNRLLGVGCTGDLVELAGVRPKRTP